jgi:hypothetical protein
MDQLLAAGGNGVDADQLVHEEAQANANAVIPPNPRVREENQDNGGNMLLGGGDQGDDDPDDSERKRDVPNLVTVVPAAPRGEHAKAEQYGDNPDGKALQGNLVKGFGAFRGARGTLPAPGG